MVDPKRHLYKLSDEDRKFVEECEEEFKDRFTKNDPEFVEFCGRPERPPPIVDPWMQNSPRRNFQHQSPEGGYRGGQRGGYGGGQRGGYNQRYNNSRGGGYQNHYRSRGGGGDRDRDRYNGDGRSYHNKRPYDRQ